ncbi:peptidylprolyl isomerase [Tenggerimyces flavus]|uniref:Peptidylprolyl isomerase n=1 Tax=Tenggerimyces flavus TaxID=1708749 RepID=A0ABV7YGN7_9ACTN|nr:peptidylprolyl isomerase [Tenggerimyces flavus]MBM7787913.1 peptidyl-prolyl cis-trans isomerase B (cyclophilin B) [Tenggerimyces flavus]
MVSRRQRQRQLAREKWERQQQARAVHRRKVRQRAIVIGAVVGVIAVIAGGYGVYLLVRDEPSEAATPTPSPSVSAPSVAPSTTPVAAPQPKAGECLYQAEAGADQKEVGLPPTKPTLAASYVASIVTSQGTITATLDPKVAPCSTNSFDFLATKNAFDKTACTELASAPAKASYLRCGSLTGTPTSGPGYIFAGENEKSASVPAGSLVMAGDANRGGSQFLVTYGKASTFDRPVTVFGKVTKGLDIVEKIAKGGVTPSTSPVAGVGSPKTAVVIQDVKITKK